MAQKPSAPLRARLRPDLIAVPMGTGADAWHVKDPVSLQFFQFDGPELGVLQMLDGRTTIDEILRRFQREFAPLHLSARQLLFFVDEARRNGLLLLEQPPGRTADNAEQRTPAASAGKWLGRLNPLAIRLPGLNPDKFLDAAYPFVRWAFTGAATVLGTIFIAAALLLVTLRFEEFLSRLPSREQFFTPDALLWMAAALAATKVVHELAHAFACKHFGGECHELGVMLLVFVPCLYCNVSDSWLLSRRRERMLITGAGMWAELLIAAAATFVWWFAIDGPVRMAALSAMIVCSASTVLLNGNPLMRYDGYYLLSDAVNVPNLSAEASRAVRGAWRRWGLGLTEHIPAQRRGRFGWLFAYGLASFLYRVLLFGTILLVVHGLAKSYQLQVLAWMITPFAIAGLVMPLLIQAAAPLARRADRRRIQPAHLTTTVVVLGALLAALFLVPVPRSVRAPFVLEADGAERIFVTAPGRLVEALPVGTFVQPGDLVGRLENLELTRELETLTAKRSLLQRQLAILTSTRGEGEEIAARIPAARQAIADVEERIATLGDNVARLELRATRSGSILHPPNVPAKPRQPEDLSQWSGSPLEPENLGCWLEAGTPYCLVGEESALSATLLVPQEDVLFVRKEQPVELLLRGAADRTLEGVVASLSEAPVEELPREIAALHLVPVDPEGGPAQRPLAPVYRVRVRLSPETDPSLLLRWSTGDGRIRLPPEPLARRLWRATGRTFHFDL